MENTQVSIVERSLRMPFVNEAKLCATLERQEIDAGGGDVFPHLPRLDADAVSSMEIRLVEQL